VEPAKKRRPFWGLPATAGAVLVGGFAALAVWSGKLDLGLAVAFAAVVFFLGGYAFIRPVGAFAVMGVAALSFLQLDLETAMLVVLGALVVFGAALVIFRK
jgi:hypothetical protein